MITFWTLTITYIMNLLDKKNPIEKGVGLVAILALFLFSCEDPSEIGLSLNPDDQVEVYFVELPLIASVTLQDSINTTRTGRLLSGNYIDPNFGQISAKSFTQVRGNFASIEEGATFDSLTLSLSLDYANGTDFSSHKILIHKLLQELKDTIYYSDDSIAIRPEVIGEKIFKNPSAGDTITMRLDQATGEKLFNDAVSNAFSNQTSFNQVFTGLSILGDEGNNGILGINTVSGASRMTLHYHTADDTLSLDFSIDNSLPGFNNIQAERTGTPLELLDSQKEIGKVNNMVFLQAGTGVIPKINISPLKEFLQADTNTNIIVNRAELIIEDAQELGEDLSPPASIRLFFTDSTNNRMVIANEFGVVQTEDVYNAILRLSDFDLSSQLNPFGPAVPLSINFDEEGQNYRSAVTLFVQTLKDRELALEQFLVFPISNGSSVNQAVFNQENIKLKIHYTSVKKL